MVLRDDATADHPRRYRDCGGCVWGDIVPPMAARVEDFGVVFEYRVVGIDCCDCRDRSGKVDIVCDYDVCRAARDMAVPEFV